VQLVIRGCATHSAKTFVAASTSAFPFRYCSTAALQAFRSSAAGTTAAAMRRMAATCGIGSKLNGLDPTAQLPLDDGPPDAQPQRTALPIAALKHESASLVAFAVCCSYPS
jgi:hypothetical protein